MDILVTGSNGLIGSWIVKELSKEYQIIGCGTKRESISRVGDYIQWNMGHEEIPGLLLEKKLEVVIHSAASKSVDDEDLELSYTNIIGTHRVINLCRKKKCETVILLSSIPIIGLPGNNPITEENLVKPLTMYHATKAAQEMMLQQLEKDGIRVVILRVPSPIAPEMSGKSIFTIFVDHAVNNKNIILNGRGTRKQNYIDVRDIAQAVRKLISSENAHGIYNIGSDRIISNLELAQKCVELAESDSEILFSGKRDFADDQIWDVDINRLKQDTGFEPSVPIEQTINERIEFLRSRSIKNKSV